MTTTSPRTDEPGASQDRSWQRRRIARTSVELTAVGFGSTAIGNMYATVDGDAASAAVEAAWDNGIRCFDTAP